MEVVAFVGSSGTGKSHRALVVAHENNIECIIDDDDKVFPMVAPGSSIAEVFDEADINK